MDNKTTYTSLAPGIEEKISEEIRKHKVYRISGSRNKQASSEIIVAEYISISINIVASFLGVLSGILVNCCFNSDKISLIILYITYVAKTVMLIIIKIIIFNKVHSRSVQNAKFPGCCYISWGLLLAVQMLAVSVYLSYLVLFREEYYGAYYIGEVITVCVSMINLLGASAVNCYIVSNSDPPAYITIPVDDK